MGSGAVIVACHSNDIWKMGGLKKHLPKTHLAFLFGCLALAGVPPFAGFWSKDEILAGVFHHTEILILLAVAAFLTAFYVTRMYCVAFLGAYRGEEECGPYAGVVPSPDLPEPLSPSKDTLGMEPEWNENLAQAGEDPDICLGAKQEHVPHLEGAPHEVPALMYGPLLVLAIFALLLGLIGMPAGLLEMLGLSTEWSIFHHWIHHFREPAHHFSLVPMIGSIVIALAGISWALSLFAKNPIEGERRLRKMLGRFHTLFAQKFYLDHFWAWTVSKTMMLWSKATSWFDDDIIDGGVRGSGLLTAMLGEKIRKEHTGKISHYLFMIAASVVLLFLLLGSVQEDFVLSPSRILDLYKSFPRGEFIR